MSWASRSAQPPHVRGRRLRVAPHRAEGDEDFPWADRIRSEVSAWTPDRLPPHFQPRTRPPGSASRRVWRPAAAVALVLIGAIVYVLIRNRRCRE